MKRTLALILVLATAFSAMLGVISTAETEETNKLDISYANLEFADTVYPLFAVDYTAVYTGDKAEASALAAIKLEVYRNGKLVETLLPATENLGNPEGTLAFKQENIGLKNMGDVYTYREVNGKDENASADVEYSILEYALETSSFGDAKLAKVVDAMIAVGASAQVALNHTDYDYNLSDKYGIVIVGGATAGTRKTIAKVGTTVTPVMNSAIFPAGAELYDLTFEKVTATTLTVTEGVSRYFYFGTDIYGDKAGAYTTATDHTGTDLHAAKITTSGTYVFDKDHNESAQTNNSKKGNLMFQMPGTTPMTGWSLKSQQSTGWSETGNNRYVAFSAQDKANVANYSGGSIEWVAGKYMLVNSVSSTGNTMPFALTSGSSKPGNAVAVPHDPSNFMNAEGKFTIGFNIAKKQGVDFSAKESTYRISKSNGHVPLFSVDGSSLVYGDTKLLDFTEFTGDAPKSAADYTSFFIVVDVNMNTMSVYAENGKSVTVALDLSYSGVSSMSAFLTGDNSFYWTFPSNGGKAYINRISFRNHEGG